jgi:predicted dehydrogenase
VDGDNVVWGTAGTVSCYDYEPIVRVQTRAKPEGFEISCDTLRAPERNPVEYFLDRIATGRALEGPLSPEISRIGQQIVDGAVQSAREKRTVKLPV